MWLLPYVSTMILFNFLVGSSYSLLSTNPINTLSWHALRRTTFTFQLLHSTRPQSGYDTSAEYERFLSSKKKKKKTRRRMALWKESQKSKEEDEDGYAAMMKRRQSWKSAVILPFANRIANFLLSPTSSNMQPGYFLREDTISMSYSPLVCNGLSVRHGYCWEKSISSSCQYSKVGG